MLSYEFIQGNNENVCIVFIHDYFGCKETWKLVQRNIQKIGYSSIAIDLPGWGNSPCLSDDVPYTPRSIAFELYELLSEQNSKLIIVCHGSSCIIASYLCKMLMDVEGILMVNPKHEQFPTIFKKCPMYLKRKYLNEYTKAETVISKLNKQHAHAINALPFIGAFQSACDINILYKYIKSMDCQLYNSVGSVLCPIHVVWSNFMPITSDATKIHILLKEIGGATYALIPNIGQFIQHEAPELLSNQILVFCTEIIAQSDFKK